MYHYLLPLAFGVLNVCHVTATCYNPDGSTITDVAYQPCNQVSGVVSMCCGTNHTGAIAKDVCLPDGLCQNLGDSNFWRQGCTDKTWKSPLCLSNLCTTKAEGGDPTNNVAVGQCADGSWCCGGKNATCCQAKAGVVLAATIGVSSTSSSSPSSATSQSSSSTGSITSTSATNTPTSNASAGGLDSGAKIGIGVGVAGGVVAIIAVVGAFLILRKRRSSDSSIHHGGQPFVPYQEVETAKTYPVEAPGYTYRAELPNGHRNVELAA